MRIKSGIVHQSGGAGGGEEFPRHVNSVVVGQWALMSRDVRTHAAYLPIASPPHFANVASLLVIVSKLLFSRQIFFFFLSPDIILANEWKGKKRMKLKRILKYQLTKSSYYTAFVEL